jgi:serine/threonine protein kinase
MVSPHYVAVDFYIRIAWLLFVFKILCCKTGNAKMVALKVMKVKSQYAREVSARLSGNFDPEYLIGMSAVHPSITECETRPEVVDIDTSVLGDVDHPLTKAIAERMFCFSMPLGDRNLYLSLKSERWVGRNALRVAQVFLQILDCVAHVHSKGWIHGDIKVHIAYFSRRILPFFLLLEFYAHQLLFILFK